MEGAQVRKTGDEAMPTEVEAQETAQSSYPSESQSSPDSTAAHNSGRPDEEVRESVLLSTKKALGLVPDFTAFDDVLIMHINSVFSVLHQLGVGPMVPFVITGETEKWTDFINQETTEMVRSYMYYKVKLLFDPPTQNSSMFNAYDALTKEQEWRLRVAGDEDRRLHGTFSASNRESTSGDFDDMPGGGDMYAG